MRRTRRNCSAASFSRQYSWWRPSRTVPPPCNNRRRCARLEGPRRLSQADSDKARGSRADRVGKPGSGRNAVLVEQFSQAIASRTPKVKGLGRMRARSGASGFGRVRSNVRCGRWSLWWLTNCGGRAQDDARSTGMRALENCADEVRGVNENTFAGAPQICLRDVSVGNPG